MGLHAPGVHSLLGPETLRCIWMEAGLLAWQLCDRGLACEGCPLDAALRAPRPAPDDPVPPFPDDRRYHPTHLWVVAPSPGRLRLGLDGFAAELLPRPHTVALPEAGHRLPARGILAVLSLPWGVVSLRTPVGGRVETVNPVLGDDPGALVAAPYTAGWLAELSLPGDRPAGVLLYSAEEMRRLTEVHRERFRRALASGLHRGAGDDPPARAPGEATTWLTVVGQLMGA